MTEDRFIELVMEIKSELAKLNTMMANTLETIAKHETRITNLENKKASLKDDLVGWLLKGLIASLLIIGSLTGASGLIVKIFGQ